MAAKTAGAVNVDWRVARLWSTLAAARAPNLDTRANTTLRRFPPKGARARDDDRKAALATPRRRRDRRAAHPADHSVSRVVSCAPAKNSRAFARADRVGARATLPAPRSRAPAPWQRRPA